MSAYVSDSALKQYIIAYAPCAKPIYHTEPQPILVRVRFPSAKRTPHRASEGPCRQGRPRAGSLRTSRFASLPSRSITGLMSQRLTLRAENESLTSCTLFLDSSLQTRSQDFSSAKTAERSTVVISSRGRDGSLTRKTWNGMPSGLMSCREWTYSSV